MEQTAKPKALIVFHILILILILMNHTWLVHSRSIALATSPSPEPVRSFLSMLYYFLTTEEVLFSFASFNLIIVFVA